MSIRDHVFLRRLIYSVKFNLSLALTNTHEFKVLDMSYIETCL